MKLTIIIPAYNEESSIEELLRKVRNVDIGNVTKEIIVVDDGSLDSTRQILAKLRPKITGMKVIFHRKNQGKGSAIRTGLAHATGDIVLIQDADLEYDPNEYSLLIRPILNGEAEVVYGSRYRSEKQRRYNIKFIKTKHKNIYSLAYLGGRFLTVLTNMLYNAKITDEPTCYKVFKTAVIKSIDLKCRQFEFCPEVTAKVCKKGYKIHEVPISYHPRTFEEGKKINWKDGFQAIWTLVKYRFAK